MIWGLFPGGADNHYHVKKSDFYIHHGFLFPQYRGNKIYEQLMIAICTKAKQNKTDITNITLAVSENNCSALKAYKNMGFQSYSKKTFITIGKWNIPQFNIKKYMERKDKMHTAYFFQIIILAASKASL